MTPLFPESVSTYIYEYSTIWRSGALLIKMMQRVITSCVTGPCKNCYVFLVLGIASWRYIFSYQDGILQSENSKWCSKEKKKKKLSDLRSLQPPRFTRKRSCPSEFIVNISSNANVEWVTVYYFWDGFCTKNRRVYGYPQQASKYLLI